jgi:hypothetical protein
MGKELSYEERINQSKETRKALYKSFQEILLKEKLNLYGFEIHICDPIDENTLFNTNRDMFTSAYLTFKDCQFAIITPQFTGTFRNDKIDGLYMGRCGHDIIGSINYHRSEKGLEEIVVEKSHQTLQSCIDEAERIRQEAVKFYSL